MTHVDEDLFDARYEAQREAWAAEVDRCADCADCEHPSLCKTHHRHDAWLVPVTNSGLCRVHNSPFVAWYPDCATRSEIQSARRPALRALRLCAEQPARGRWRA